MASKNLTRGSLRDWTSPDVDLRGLASQPQTQARQRYNKPSSRRQGIESRYVPAGESWGRSWLFLSSLGCLCPLKVAAPDCLTPAKQQLYHASCAVNGTVHVRTNPTFHSRLRTSDRPAPSNRKAACPGLGASGQSGEQILQHRSQLTSMPPVSAVNVLCISNSLHLHARTPIHT